ncbi:hypothetical protein [Maridesulfovibrio sp.]|uniref:hypothetical protein n=1 Tax=unclassified Maridesulfovibrio TaxID=2794999 RepID=UPI003AFF9C08
MNKNWALKNYSHGAGNVVLRLTYSQSNRKRSRLWEYLFLTLGVAISLMLLSNKLLFNEHNKIMKVEPKPVEFSLQTEAPIPTPAVPKHIPSVVQNTGSTQTIENIKTETADTKEKRKPTKASKPTKQPQSEKMAEQTTPLPEKDVVQSQEQKEMQDEEELAEAVIDTSVSDFAKFNQNSTVVSSLPRSSRNTAELSNTVVEESFDIEIRKPVSAINIPAPESKRRPRNIIASADVVESSIIPVEIHSKPTPSDSAVADKPVRKERVRERLGGDSVQAAEVIPKVKTTYPSGPSTTNELYSSAAKPRREAAELGAGSTVKEAPVILNGPSGSGKGRQVDTTPVPVTFGVAKEKTPSRPGTINPVEINKNYAPPISLTDLRICADISSEEQLLIEIVTELRLRQRKGQLKNRNFDTPKGNLTLSGPLHTTSIAVVLQPIKGVRFDNRCDLLEFVREFLKAGRSN